MAGSAFLEHHQHGKSKVRLGCVWRTGRKHDMAEWSVDITLASDCAPAFTDGDNTNIVATDTMKNTVYVLAKKCGEKVSMEDFACIVARHFVSMYPVVSQATVRMLEKPWERVMVAGKPHEHGFKLGSERHTVEVVSDKVGQCSVTCGLRDFSLLKTTQAGFEGFIHDQYTMLPDTRERIVASTIAATWRYSAQPECYSAAYAGVKETMTAVFFGPSTGGSYSPSVQNTLYQMASKVLEKYPSIESVSLNMPNLHFLPMSMPSIGLTFENDVYLPTSEPHGTIEATVSRRQGVPLKARL